MKTELLASTPGKSSTTTAMEDQRSESRDSCYFPGCRKDANCNCKICLASINATLDLMPISVQKSSLTKLSTSEPDDVESTPISFISSNMSTPRSSANRAPGPPVLKSNARLDSNEKMGRRERERGLSGRFMRLVLGLNLIFIAEFGLSRGISGVLRPVLSPGIVKNVGEKSWVAQDLKGKLRFVQRELQSLVDAEVSNCSNTNSVWKIDQDGLLLNSRCTLYKSAVEEVRIWGWPLQTAGLLMTEFSSRSFTILSGRVTEWTDGKVGYLIRKANTSWVHRKWGASVVQLNPDTWVLEYRRSSVLDDSRLFLVAVEFLKYRISKMVRSVKQEFWFFSHALRSNHFSQFTSKYDTKIPT
ncbi:hypothetical protein I3842_02G096600 [Carya illinoinensis]|uniref:ERG2/sigma1 receptor-like protein n=1 Tax=Carya illinoinensis TaxID=32201 RepID=A0A922FQV5_CARIL|nr:hypothetical protein I3842_02G096600 [Carya illinoinensis]